MNRNYVDLYNPNKYHYSNSIHWYLDYRFIKTYGGTYRSHILYHYELQRPRPLNISHTLIYEDNK